MRVHAARKAAHWKALRAVVIMAGLKPCPSTANLRAVVCYGGESCALPPRALRAVVCYGEQDATLKGWRYVEPRSGFDVRRTADSSNSVPRPYKPGAPQNRAGLRSE